MAASELLTQKLAQVRRAVLLNNAGTALAITLIVGVELLGLAMFLDWWIELPMVWRAVLLIVQLGVMAYLLGKHVVPHLLHRLTDEQLARLVERLRPELRTRLIASVQLGRPGALPPGASAIMVDALVEQTEAAAARIDFNKIVSRDRFNTLAAAAACVLVIAIIGFLSGRPVTSDLLKRALLGNVPVPRKTLVEVLAGDRVVGRGDTVVIGAIARGIVPRIGSVEVHDPNGPVRTLLMNSTGEDEALFTYALPNVHQSFRYRVRLNDGRSEFFRVDVLPRPAIAKLECHQKFPSYTGLPPTQRAPTDLILLAGSVLTITGTSTKDLASAGVRLAGLETTVAAEIRSDREFVARLPILSTNLVGFSIDLRDAAGMSSIDPVLYRIQVIPDRAPALSITVPRRVEELVTRSALVLVGMEATDDFGITALNLRHRADQTNASIQSITLDLGTNATRQARHRFEWRIPALPQGQRLEFWLEATDNNDVTGPSLGASAHQFIRIVTEDEKRADLWNRATDSLSLISELAVDQDKLNQELGTIIRAKTNP